MKLEIGSIVNWSKEDLWRIDGLGEKRDAGMFKVTRIGSIGKINMSIKGLEHVLPKSHVMFSDECSILYACPKHSVIFDLT